MLTVLTLLVSLVVLLWWGAWYLIFVDEALLKLFDLLFIFDLFTFDSWDQIFLTASQGLGLLKWMSVYWLAVCWGPWDLRSALELWWQALFKFLVEVLLLLLGSWSSDIIVVNLLLSRIDGRVLVFDSSCLG